MKTKLPIPEPQGNTPMERLDWAFRTVLRVPKAAMAKDAKKPRHGKAKKESQ